MHAQLPRFLVIAAKQFMWPDFWFCQWTGNERAVYSDAYSAEWIDLRQSGNVWTKVHHHGAWATQRSCEY